MFFFSVQLTSEIVQPYSLLRWGSDPYGATAPCRSEHTIGSVLGILLQAHALTCRINSRLFKELEQAKRMQRRQAYRAPGFNSHLILSSNQLPFSV